MPILNVERWKIFEAKNLDPYGKCCVDVARRVMDFFSWRQPHTPAQIFPELTDREHELLALLAQGLTNATIAERLSLSPKTVRNHVSNIFSKLQVVDRAQAIIRAREAGLG